MKTKRKSESLADSESTEMRARIRETLSVVTFYDRAVRTDRAANRTIYFYVENEVLM